MIPYHLVFCGLVRNAEKNLLLNLQRIEEIRPHFQKVSVIIFENDSYDRTKEVLSQYANSTEGVQVTMVDFGQDPLNKGPYSRHRIDLMSQYRNQYLKALKKLDSVDYVCVIDLDVFHFDTSRFLACFDDCNWDVRSALGINRVEYLWGYVFYDIYAYADVDDYTVLPFYNFEEFKSRQKSLYRACRNARELIPVGSNFNGLAIYKAEALLSGVEYSGAEAQVEGVARRPRQGAERQGEPEEDQRQDVHGVARATQPAGRSPPFDQHPALTHFRASRTGPAAAP